MHTTMNEEIDENLPSAMAEADTKTQRTRPLWALIATQFQGAFSDNILRNLLLSMIVGMQMQKAERDTLVLGGAGFSSRFHFCF